MREHRIICKKCGAVFALADLQGFCARPRCGKCFGKLYGVVDARGGLTVKGVADEMAEVECKDVRVRDILLDAATYLHAKPEIRKNGKMWGFNVLMEGLFIPEDERDYAEA